MLINFWLENCLSYKDLACFDTRANKESNEKETEEKPNSTEEKLDNIFEVDKTFFKEGESNRFVKSAVIYGANASGKTNLIRSMAWLKDFILHSKANTENIALKFQPFLFSPNSGYVNLGIEFIAGDDNKYKYILNVNTKIVHSETLRIFNKKTKHYKKIFTRELEGESKDKDGTIKYNYQIKKFGNYMKSLNEKAFNRIENKCTHNKSLIPILEEEGVEVAKFVWRWFENKFYVFANMFPDIRDSYFKYEKGDNKISEILFKLGLGKIRPVYKILQGESEKANFNIPAGVPWVFKDGKLVLLLGFEHDKIFVPIQNESSGLISLYAFLGSLLNLFERGLTLVIDEFDRNLHPDVIASIINMVHNPKINSKNGQLIFITHSDGLLDSDIDLFRREQVWFIERISDKAGSNIFSLNDVDNYEFKRGNKRKAYRSGKIGARPYIREALLEFLEEAR